MTNNDNNNENEMTMEFENYEVTNEELESADKFYDSLNLELGEIENETNVFETSQTSFDEMLEVENSYDETRDSDFYGYDD